MAHLGQTDRDAVLLRYFQNKNLREVGAALGVSEDTAQKRVSRAVEKLRCILVRRNVMVPAAAMACAISANAVLAAPVGFARSLAAATLNSAFADSTLALVESTQTALAWAKLKAQLATLAAPCLLATCLWPWIVAGFQTPAQVELDHTTALVDRAPRAAETIVPLSEPAPAEPEISDVAIAPAAPQATVPARIRWRPVVYRQSPAPSAPRVEPASPSSPSEPEASLDPPFAPAIASQLRQANPPAQPRIIPRSSPDRSRRVRLPLFPETSPSRP
jgi:hypothetical protein